MGNSDNFYARAKKAKNAVKAKDMLGWPYTKEGINRLFEELPEDEKMVLLLGRFVRMWNGKWQFSFPQTKRVVEAIEGLLPKRKELIFMEYVEW